MKIKWYEYLVLIVSLIVIILFGYQASKSDTENCHWSLACPTSESIRL
jgi:hypothetical protein